MVEMVRIQKEDFSVDEEIKKVQKASKSIGGIVTFLGTARDFSKGHDIDMISFEHYDGMAEKKLKELRDEMLDNYDIIELSIVHRIGDVRPGDNIVLIIAAAKHRVEAFNACRSCIDELKRVIPIWKKEISPDGDCWVEEHP